MRDEHTSINVVVDMKSVKALTPYDGGRLAGVDSDNILLMPCYGMMILRRGYGGAIVDTRLLRALCLYRRYTAALHHATRHGVRNRDAVRVVTFTPHVMPSPLL